MELHHFTSTCNLALFPLLEIEMYREVTKEIQHTGGVTGLGSFLPWATFTSAESVTFIPLQSLLFQLGLSPSCLLTAGLFSAFPAAPAQDV